MAITRCSNGHYYDDEKFFRCPYCGISLITEEDKKDTFLTGDETILQSELEDDGGRTVAFWGNESGEDYVTGWLVCVAGPEKGRDFRLHYGFNRIGRSYQMDICCEEDLQITRDNHCSVIYDEKENTFSIMPATGTLTYLNGQTLMHTKSLHTGDRIRIGQSIFEFVAFCKGEKKWKENMV